MPGQRLQPRVLQAREVGRQVLVRAAGALEHLERAEGVDVNRRRAGAHRRDHVDVVVAVEVGVDAALQADLGGAALLGLAHALADLVEGQEVGIAAQVERERPLGKGAEAALESADVGVVDVAVDDEADGVAHESPSHGVGEVHDGLDSRRPRALNRATSSSRVELVARARSARAERALTALVRATEVGGAGGV